MHWWKKFTDARFDALKAMQKEGKTSQEMVQVLNLSDSAHAERILANAPLIERDRAVTHFKGSILASSDPSIYQRVEGAYGTLEVRAINEMEEHGLFFIAKSSEDRPDIGNGMCIAMHPNGYSCHALLKRIIAAWEAGTDAAAVQAMQQFDYILRCGGLCGSRETMEYVVKGN